MSITLYNTLTRRKEELTPLDAKNVRMYVCGPTVYDRPHLGNARSVVVYDVLYRLLKFVYGEDHVTYVRNITDVDDKINAAAKSTKEPISALTSRVEKWFHDDMNALNVLPATRTLNGNTKSEKIIGCMGEPHATHHVPHMIKMIEELIANKHAYVAQGHVLFDIMSVPHYADAIWVDDPSFVYGRLSGRKIDDLIAGARVEVESYKKHPGDFVLWKPGEKDDDASSVFDSPWGKGRPGWHIECSAMSSTYLGDDFDIHGGGADLMFPHHENEIAQSRCARPGSQFARSWVHNGFLTVGGEKMSKSLGNFITVRDLLDKGVKGEVIRLALLSAKYNEPLDWNEKLLEDSKKTLNYFYKALSFSDVNNPHPDDSSLDEDFLNALKDDLNLPAYFAKLHSWGTLSHKAAPNSESQRIAIMMLRYYGQLIGLFQIDPKTWFKGEVFGSASITEAADTATGIGGLGYPFIPESTVKLLIDQRLAAKKAKNFAEADRIRKELADQGIILEDRPDGTTDWRRA